jgi:hypothetical protein
MTDDDLGFELTRRRTTGLLGATAGALALGGSATASQEDENDNHETEDKEENENEKKARRFRVTVANLTGGQPFTPPAVAAHRPSFELFSVGDEATRPVQQVAENGDLDPLLGLIGEADAVRASAVGNGPLVPAADPGDTGRPHSVSLTLAADGSATHLTFISMLIATNDGFVGLDTVSLPARENASRSYYASSYDAGSEKNTENFGDMVPPADGLMGVNSPDQGTGSSDEAITENGVIAPHPGIDGTGDLDPAVFGWRDPAALVQVERID